MRKPTITVFAGIALLALSLAVLPGRGQSSTTTEQGSGWTDESSAAEVRAQIARLQAKLAELQGRFQEDMVTRQAELQAQLAARQAKQLTEKEVARAKLYAELAAAQAGVAAPQARGFVFDTDGDSGWLGVSVEEVSAEKAKELKLSAPHGVLITDVDADGPAAKAGLKANDIVTDYNGQRVEGTAQLRRLIRETPPGRTAQLAVWRDGRSQNISVTLGDYSEQVRSRIRVMRPRDFSFSLNIPDGAMKLFSPTPVLGIGVQDLSGQLGSYFGAPGGEGVLVTEVRSGSPAEKGGMKAGDVILKIDGARVRTTGDLRDQLREKREKKTVSVTVLRKGSETSLNVEIEHPKPPTAARRTITYRTL
jgi:serine protease Do